MAAQRPPPPEQVGRQLQYEGDWDLQGPPRQADHGEDPHPKLSGASFDEQKDGDGWSEGRENAVSTVGGRRLGWVAPYRLPGRP